MPGSTGKPHFTFTVGGTPHDVLANRVRLHALIPYSSRRPPQLTWSIPGGPAPPIPDPYLGKSITLAADEGSGSYPLFAGTCEEVAPVHLTPLGWERTYTAEGLRALADRLVPVTSILDGTDAITFNRRIDDVQFDPALAGLTVGRMVRIVLEGATVIAGLAAIGVGGCTSPNGAGATAAASVAGGHVTVQVQTPGAGYDHADPPSAVLIGGGGTYSACTVTVDNSGAVTGVTVTGSSGYTAAPEVWISPLPAATLADLAAGGLAIIPPYAVTIQGDAVLQAVEGCLRQNCKNHYLHVGPDGIIRIFDLRDAESAPTTLTLNSTDPADPIVDLGRVALSRSVGGCYGKVVVRGGPDAVVQLFSTADGTLERYYGHDGLTNDAAEAAWKISDFTDPSTVSASTTGAAQFTAQVSGGSVTMLSMTNAGSDYTPNRTYDLAFSGGGGSGAKAQFTTDNTGVAFTWTVKAGGAGYGSAPTVTAPAPGSPGGNIDTGTITARSSNQITVQSSDATRTWPADYWAWGSGEKHATVYIRSSAAGITQLYSARIVGHPALTAGGTCVFTLDRTIPAVTYTDYRIVGTAGGAAEVYRRYRPTDPDVRKNLMTYFPFPQVMPLGSGTGTALETMVAPTAYLRKSGGAVGGVTMDLSTDVIGGSYLLAKPAVVPFSTPSNLRKGGSSVDGKPDDIQIFGSVRVGSLQSIAPASGYEGTGYTVEGLSRTLAITCPDWIDRGNQSNMDAMARDFLDSVKDAVVEGVVPLIGWRADWLTTPNRAVTLAASYTIPWIGIPLPATECEVAFRADSHGEYLIDLRVSNRRGATHAALYERPPRVGGFLSGVGGVFAGAPTEFGFSPAAATPADWAGDPWGRLGDWSPAGAGAEFATPAGGSREARQQAARESDPGFRRLADPGVPDPLLLPIESPANPRGIDSREAARMRATAEGTAREEARLRERERAVRPQTEDDRIDELLRRRIEED